MKQITFNLKKPKVVRIFLSSFPRGGELFSHKLHFGLFDNRTELEVWLEWNG